jgi:SAM-dependent methyltransferase
VLRSAVSGAVSGVRNDGALISILDTRRVRTVVPDAATGVQWGGEEVFLDILDPYLGGSIHALELGCGGGRITRLVAPKVAELVASDISDAMLAEARENLRGVSNVRFRRVSPLTLASFPDRSFDVVFSHDVFVQFEMNQTLALLDEACRVLKPGGHCVVSFLTIDRPAWAAKQLELVRNAARSGGFGPSLSRPYVSSQLHALFEAAGLEVVAYRHTRFDDEVDRPHYVIAGRRPPEDHPSA